MTIPRPIDEYLFDRRSLFGGPGFIQTSSYLLPRRLFDKVRFNVESPHDDWEFRVAPVETGRGENRNRAGSTGRSLFRRAAAFLTSRTSSWSASLRWLDEHTTDHHPACL